jgi:predicted molibdopterin-dependent oxidoreductase YjgC
VAQATVAIGVRAWAEVRGTLVNCQNRIQLMQACPVLPNAELEPTWRELAALAGAGWGSELDAFRHAQALSPALAGISYRAIGPMGRVLEPAAAAVAG